MTMECFRYQRPEEIERVPRLTVDIFKSEVADARILVLDHAGETNLHSHEEADAVWFVLGGRAMFYDERDVGHEVGPHEGVVVPRLTKYWFEAISEEPLEILRVAGKDVRIGERPAITTNLRSGEQSEARHPHLAIERIDEG